MPFLVNGEKVNLKDKDSEFAKVYQASLKALKSSLYAKKGSITFKLTSNFNRQENDLHRGSRMAFTGNLSLMLKKYYVAKEFAGTVQYYSSESVSASNVVSYLPRRFDITGRGKTFSIAHNEELLFFLIFVMPGCGRVPQFNGLQNKGAVLPQYYLFDENTNAEVSITDEKLLTRIKFMIVDEELGLGEDRIRALAEFYGVNVSEQHTLDKVRVDLMAAVIKKTSTGYNTKLLNDFMTQVKSDGKVDAVILARKAAKSGIITLKKTPKTQKWIIATIDGESQEICSVGKLEDPIMGLAAYLMNNEKEFIELNELLGK